MYLEVPLDHFDPTTTKTWKDKFYINRGSWDEKDGPIFVEMGGGNRSSPLLPASGGAESWPALLIRGSLHSIHPRGSLPERAICR